VGDARLAHGCERDRSDGEHFRASSVASVSALTTDALACTRERTSVSRNAVERRTAAQSRVVTSSEGVAAAFHVAVAERSRRGVSVRGTPSVGEDVDRRSRSRQAPVAAVQAVRRIETIGETE